MTNEELELYRRELERLNEKHEREYRRAIRKYEWDRRHYRTLSCRVPVETAQRFAKLCFRYGKTPYHRQFRAQSGSVIHPRRRRIPTYRPFKIALRRTL